MQSPPAHHTSLPPAPVQRGGHPQPDIPGFGDDGLTFHDLLDVINPFQHLPIVSTIYRAATEDVIAPIPRLLGGALFGGLIGAVSSLINIIVEEISGYDLGGHVVNFIDHVVDGDDGAAITQANFVIPPFPVDETEYYRPPDPPAVQAMTSATRSYGAASELSSPPSGMFVDTRG